MQKPQHCTCHLNGSYKQWLLQQQHQNPFGINTAGKETPPCEQGGEAHLALKNQMKLAKVPQKTKPRKSPKKQCQHQPKDNA